MNARRETGTGTAHHVVILGAGYAGMAAAVQLAARVKRREGVRATVVNAQERFTERMRLHMTATGQRLAGLSVPEMLEGTGARFVRGWVTAVDADARTVRIDDDRVLSYDTLVYGLGGVADTSAVPGAEDHAYTLDSAQDAELLADRLARLGGGTVVVAATVAAWFAALGTVTYQGVEPADMKAELVEVNGGPGIVFSAPDRVIATLTFDFDADGRITALHDVANPDKLHAVADGTSYDIGTR